MGNIAYIICVVVVVVILIAIGLIMRVYRHDRPVAGGGARVHHCTIGEALLDARHGQLVAGGGGARVLARAKPKTGTKPGRRSPPWTTFPTWDALFADPSAAAEYEHDRKAFLGDLDVDWSEVLATTLPKVNESREYIGRINRDARTGRMAVVEMVASPTQTGAVTDDPGSIAMIPAGLVEAIVSKPALLVFHTHPAQGFEYPSPADLVSAAYTLLSNRGAADLVISRFGIHMLNISDSLRADALAAPKPYVYLNRVLHDFVTGFDGIRSWDHWTIDKMNALYGRYRFVCLTFPTPAYVSTSTRRWSVIRDGQTTDALLRRLRGGAQRPGGKNITIEMRKGPVDTRRAAGGAMRHEGATRCAPRSCGVPPTRRGLEAAEGFPEQVVAAARRDPRAAVDYAQFRTVPASKFSCLMPWDAAQVTRFVEHAFPVRDRICDLTAHIGCDLMNFAYHNPSAQLTGVEVDPAVFSVLEENVARFDRADPAARYGERIRVVLGSAKDFVTGRARLECDIVYMDPPWGGPDYVKRKSVSLRLGDTTAAKMAGAALSRGAGGVLLKAPLNFDVDQYISDLRACVPYAAIKVMRADIVKQRGRRPRARARALSEATDAARASRVAFQLVAVVRE